MSQFERGFEVQTSLSRHPGIEIARYSQLAVLAVASFSAAATLIRPLVAASVAAVGMISLTVVMFGPSQRAARGVYVVAGVTGLVVIGISSIVGLGPVPESVYEIRVGWTALMVISCLCLVLSRKSFMLRRLAVTSALLAVVSVTAAEVISDWSAPGGYDVYRNHQAAGDALLDGENPYGDAVQVTSGNPFAPEDTVIIGYSYPPTVLGTYGLAAAFTDPRIVSMLAWFAVLAWFGAKAARERQHSRLVLSLVVLLATAPIWPLVWYSGWTEPLSIGLLLASGVRWKDRPALSAILLGLAFSSKQYFILLLPLLLLHREEGQLKRAVIAGSTVFLTMIPALLIDASTYLQATIGNLSDIGFRPDSQSLTGLLAEIGIEFSLTPAAWVAASLVFAAFAAMRSRSPSDFYMTAALILGFSFWIGQAFPNYWFLVMALTGIGLALKASDKDGAATRSRPELAS